jgi:hypothetical protein
MENEREEQGKKMGELIKKAWEDEAFMARLLEDATTVLAEEGIKLPEGMKVKAVTNTGDLSYLLIPPKPKTGLSDLELDAISGGWCGDDFAQNSRCQWYRYAYNQPNYQY